MGNPTLSSTSICNSALLKLGGDIIGSLTDGTRAATLCNAMYATLRDEVMGAAPWRFAMVQAQLSAQATAPLFEYLYAFQIPSDCLRVLRTDDDKWTQQQQLILCNNPGPINVTYIQQNTDETTWDARFAEALAWRMAMELALSLVQSMTVKQEMEKSYMMAIKEARSVNAVIGTSQKLIADIWSGARKGFDYLDTPVAATPTEYYD